MRKSLKRALALATSTPLLAGTLVAGAPAAHALTAPSCGPGSTVLVDFYTLGLYRTRIATFDVSSTVSNVCIQLFGIEQVVLVVNRGVSLTPPSVTQTSGVGACAQPVIDMTAPVALSLSVGVTTTGPAICLGQNGVTTTVSFNAASVQSLPDVEVYTVRNTMLNAYGTCGHFYVGVVTGTGSPNDYYDCATTDNQLI